MPSSTTLDAWRAGGTRARPAPDAPVTLGAVPGPGGTRFTVWAPAAHTLAIRLLDADGRPRGDHPLDRAEDGDWTGTLPGVGAGDDYLVLLDGERALPDPASRWQPHGVHGPSRIVDPAAFRWTDDAWRGLRAMADHVVYELHVGTYTPEGTFDAVVPHLPMLCALGVTALELMPIAAFPGARNWGYDGVHLYAPQHDYGGPEGLRRLVDAAHGAGLAVLLDVVYNHLGPEGNYLGAFGPYFSDRYRTPWGAAVNYDGADSAGVRRHVVENARHWIGEYHLDGLRLDAVHGIHDAGTPHLLAELTDAVHAQGDALGRRVWLVAESDLNDPRTVQPTRDGGLGFDAQWADDLHHAVHVALTGETRGYYASFGDAAALRDTLTSAFRRPGHGFEPARPTIGVASPPPRDRMIVCAQNHDQVGNRATGDRLAALVDPPRQRLAAALVLASGYVPMLWMGEEWGETTPFLYFVSHGDPELLAAVRRGRREEFAAFGWGDAVPDPGDPATHARSVLDAARHAREPHAGTWRLYRDLLALRRAEPALRPGAADVAVDAPATAAADARVLRTRFQPREGGRLVCLLANATEGAAAVALPGADGAPWRCLLATDDPRYGGDGRPAAARADGAVPLAPWTAQLWAAGD